MLQMHIDIFNILLFPAGRTLSSAVIKPLLSIKTTEKTTHTEILLVTRFEKKPVSKTSFHCNVCMVHKTRSHLFSEMGDHLVKHGDGVKDIAFTVQDCDFIVQVNTNSKMHSQLYYSTIHSPR